VCVNLDQFFFVFPQDGWKLFTCTPLSQFLRKERESSFIKVMQPSFESKTFLSYIPQRKRKNKKEKKNPIFVFLKWGCIPLVL
jgi:hypothetical protein